MKRIVAAAAALLAASCGGASDKADKNEPSGSDAEIAIVGADDLAEKFVKLGLALGEHDSAYVDAYTGPKEWAEAAKAEQRSLEDLERDADEILEALAILNPDGADRRLSGLARVTRGARTRIQMAKGEKFPFNEEARLLYGVTPPDYSLEEFDAALAEIDALLPGDAALSERVDAFKNSLLIQEDRRQAVFDAAIAECRNRTRAHYSLPEDEKFNLRFVTDKPWSGYNWYQGNFESVIEVNTDLPIAIDRAVGLGCHEGYPGHHVWNVIIERDLRRQNGWIEFSIFPLFSPQALLGEGSANYGVSLAFPGDEKVRFERDVLFPLAGIDPAKAPLLATLNEAESKLSHAGNFIAREYLDGRMDAETAVSLLMKYQLFSRERAEQRLRFIDGYRSYVINYNIGRDLVARHIEGATAAGDDPWETFERLLSDPDAVSTLASD